MRQDFFTYLPAFKLVIAGNHKPGLRGVDEAIRRRFHLVPFTVTIAKPDRDLPDKLRAEWPGILQWMIEGCLAWQRRGAEPARSCGEATEAYLGEEDAHRPVDRGVLRRRPEPLGVAAPTLDNNGKNWSEAAGERPGSQRRFSQALEGCGFAEPQHERTGSIFSGIALKP